MGGGSEGEGGEESGGSVGEALRAVGVVGGGLGTHWRPLNTS